MGTLAVHAELSDEPLRAQQVDAEHPWPGLWPFTEESEPFFNGRAREIVELARLVRRETLTVLTGQSGLGKSSLLMAGLFPMLRREDYLPVYVRLDHSHDSLTLGEQIFAQLFRECDKEGVEAPPRGPGVGLWEYLHGADATFWSRKNRVLTPLFVIDQFEEMFTVGRPSERTLFEEEIAELVANRLPPVLAVRLAADPNGLDSLELETSRYKLVLGIREDYVAALDGMRHRMPMSLQQRLRLKPMDGEQALEAVRKTGGQLVDNDVAGAIVRFLSKGPGGLAYEDRRELSHGEVDPALLSIVCYELNVKRLRLGRPRITTDLLEDKTQREILTAFYERSFQYFDPRTSDYVNDLHPAMRVFVEEKLLTDDGLFRISAVVNDAIRRPGVTAEALSELIGRRLLRTDVRAHVQHVELTHDVLADVVRESRDGRRVREQQAQARRELLASEADAQQRAASARRFTWVVGPLGLLCLIAALVAALEARAAGRERDNAKRQKNVADSSAREEHKAELRALKMADSVKRTNETLQLTIDRLESAQDSVRLEQLKGLVAAELADPFLRMSGSIVRHRIAQDSAMRVTVQSDIQKADAIRAEARQLADRAKVIEAELCRELQQVAAAPDTKAPLVTDAAKLTASASRSSAVTDAKSSAKPDSITLARLLDRIRTGLKAQRMDDRLVCGDNSLDERNRIDKQ